MSEQRLCRTDPDIACPATSQASVNDDTSDVTVRIPATGVAKDGHTTLANAAGGSVTTSVAAGTGTFAQTQQLASGILALTSDIPPPGSETLQDAYDASTSPQIVTSAGLGALAVRRGSAADTDSVLEVQSGAGTINFSVRGDGVVAAATSFSAINGALNAKTRVTSTDGGWTANGVAYQWPSSPGTGTPLLTLDPANGNLTWGSYGVSLDADSGIGVSSTTPGFTLNILGGTGISTVGSGNWNATISLNDTAVTPGTYTYATVTVDQQGRITSASSGAAPTGTVTSVALTMPTAIFDVAGSPVTTSGTFAVTLDTQTANTVFAGPSTGSPAAPTFRALVAADLPAGTTPVRANPTATVNGTATNGSAGTFISSDGAPALANPVTPASGLQGFTTGVQVGVASSETGPVRMLNSANVNYVEHTAPTVTGNRSVLDSDSAGTIVLRGRQSISANASMPYAEQGFTYVTNFSGSGNAYFPEVPVLNECRRIIVAPGDTLNLYASVNETGTIYFPSNATKQALAADGEYYTATGDYVNLTAECTSNSPIEWVVVAHEGDWTFGEP